MNQDRYSNESPQGQTAEITVNFSAQKLIGVLLLVALIAFELFNFDTTKFALMDFFGGTSFAGMRWATILAIAFCAIDFAGLVRFFTPEKDGEAAKEIWYLMGAWMLGATLNALMTWWAVTLTLLNHDLGNEILNREELLRVVPLFVAALVWLTRVLFIGAFTVAGGHVFNFAQKRPSTAARARQQPVHPSLTPVHLSSQQTRRPQPTNQKQSDQGDEEPDSFPFSQSFPARRVQRTPTAVYARSRRSEPKE